jgi:hypothetical protein
VFVPENFDIKTMRRNIITSVTEPGQQCMYSELADLQRKLATVMNGQRVFLVLDDVRDERTKRLLGVVLCSYDSCKGLPDHSYHSERGSGKADTDYAFLSPKLSKL